MDLRGGRLLRADGGFFDYVCARNNFGAGVWRALKRTLNHNRLEIQPAEMFNPFGGSAIEAGSDSHQSEGDSDRATARCMNCFTTMKRIFARFQSARRV